MSSIRCKYCGLTNFADAVVCKRCGNPLRQPTKQKPPVRFSFYALLAFAVVGVIVYYSIGGFENAITDVNLDESHYKDRQRAENPNNLSRQELDRQRANSYGNAVKASNSLAVAQGHNQELEKAIKEAK